MRPKPAAFRVECLETRYLPSAGCLSLFYAEGAKQLDADKHIHSDSEPAATDGAVAAAGSPQVLFLDFDGGTVNSNPCGFSYSTPYHVSSFNLSPLGFGGQEETAEDY